MEFVQRSLRWQRIALGLALAGSALGFARSTLDIFNTYKATVIALVAIAIAVIGAVRISRTRRLEVPRTVAWWPLGAFAVALIAATVVSDTPGIALVGRTGRHTGLALYLVYAFLFATAIRLYRDHPPDGLVRALLVTAVPVAGYGLLQAVGVDPLDWTLVEGGPPVFSTFGNANFFSAWLGIVVPLAVLGALTAAWPFAVRAASGLLAVVSLGVAFASGSLQGPVAGLAGTAVVLGAWLFTSAGLARRQRWTLAGGAAVIALLGVGASVAGAGPLAGVRQGVLASLDSRVGKWESALAMFADRPVFGFGLESFIDWFHLYRTVDLAVESGLQRTTDTPHNVPLDMLASGGLVLFLAYLAVVAVTGWALVVGLRRLDGEQRLLLAGLGGAWTAYQVQSLVSIDVPPLAVLHWVLAGAIVALGTAPAVREIPLPGAVAAPAAASPKGNASRKGNARRKGKGRRAGRGRAEPAAPRLAPANPLVLGGVAVVALAAVWIATLPYRAEAAARDASVAQSPEAAAAGYERAIAIAPWESRYHGMLGALLAGQGDHAAAAEVYERALDREPRGLAHTINLGRTAHQAGRDDVADAAFARVLELDPNTPEILVEVANYRLEREDSDRAEELLDRAVQLRGDNATWWVALGRARSAQGDPEGAREAFTRALELDPDVEGAEEGLAALA